MVKSGAVRGSGGWGWERVEERGDHKWWETESGGWYHRVVEMMVGDGGE